MPKIKSISCYKVVNSRGDWTIDAKVVLDDGSEGSQTVPDGASKGKNEAVYIPVNKAVEVVSTVINDALHGEDAFDQQSLDKVLISMDGTSNKRHLGGNSILSVSLAVCKAAAQSRGVELYQYLKELYGNSGNREGLKFPVPIFNILNGGKHANNNLSFQEFMIVPSLEKNYEEALNIGLRVYHSLKTELEKEGADVGVGDEGGFAPSGLTSARAYETIKKAVGQEYRLGKDIFFGMDAAAGSFYEDERYAIKEENLSLDTAGMKKYYAALLKDFEIIYLEDPFYETDYGAWEAFGSEFLNKLLIVGDDLVVTNANILRRILGRGMINAVIVKPNQVGTLTETLEFIRLAQKSGIKIIVSHRSGDTAEDTFIADLALAVGADFIKAGAPVRGERVAKYNRLLDVYSLKGKDLSRGSKL